MKGSASHKYLGANPKCATCGLREAESRAPGAECNQCKAVKWRRETVARERLQRAVDICSALKKSDRDAFGDMFSCLHSALNRGTSAQNALKACEFVQRNAGRGEKPRDLRQYFNGIVRSLTSQDEAKRLRSGGGLENRGVLDVFAELLRRSGYAVEKK